jgi:acetyltransferase-like isoleucine patch superfamily enzyme
MMQQRLKSKGPVRIGAGSFLGYRAVVLPGVTLGPHCVVGAQAVVTESFAEGSMVAGNPARLLKRWDGERWAGV